MPWKRVAIVFHKHIIHVFSELTNFVLYLIWSLFLRVWYSAPLNRLKEMWYKQESSDGKNEHIKWHRRQSTNKHFMFPLRRDTKFRMQRQILQSTNRGGNTIIAKHNRRTFSFFLSEYLWMNLPLLCTLLFVELYKIKERIVKNQNKTRNKWDETHQSTTQRIHTHERDKYRNVRRNIVNVDFILLSFKWNKM